MDLKKRHKETDIQLKKLAPSLFDKKDSRDRLYKIAANCNVTAQTVKNYIYGIGSDGYLKDAIIEELKKIK